MMAKKATCSDQLFKGRHFEREIIFLCVRWYLRFKLPSWRLLSAIWNKPKTGCRRRAKPVTLCPSATAVLVHYYTALLQSV